MVSSFAVTRQLRSIATEVRENCLEGLPPTLANVRQKRLGISSLSVAFLDASDGAVLAFMFVPAAILGAGRPTVLQYCHALAAAPTEQPNGLKSVIVLMAWELWKERNARVFNNQFSTPLDLFQKIKNESRN